MIGLDTNVLVRFITRDDKLQASQVMSFIQKYQDKEQVLYINKITICQVVWVLKKGYHYKKEELLSLLKFLIHVKEFCFEDFDSVEETIELYETCSVDFADILVSISNKKAHCHETISFDSKAIKHNIFSSLN
ncbi:MAG: PIN domain-containing protein [Gammaproteobacteria bacterium]